MSQQDGVQLKGMRLITDSEDGGINNTLRSDWTGLLALLLRKIMNDMYFGKGKSEFEQLPDRKITYAQFDELLEEYIKKVYVNDLSDKELNSIKTHLTTAFSQNGISIKTFGEFLSVLDLDALVISVTVARKGDKDLRTYAQSIGRFTIGQTDLQPINQQMLDDSGLLNESIVVEESVVGKKMNKANDPNKKERKKRHSQTLSKLNQLK